MLRAIRTRVQGQALNSVMAGAARETQTCREAKTAVGWVTLSYGYWLLVTNADPSQAGRTGTRGVSRHASHAIAASYATPGGGIDQVRGGLDTLLFLCKTPFFLLITLSFLRTRHGIEWVPPRALRRRFSSGLALSSLLSPHHFTNLLTRCLAPGLAHSLLLTFCPTPTASDTSPPHYLYYSWFLPPDSPPYRFE